VTVDPPSSNRALTLRVFSATNGSITLNSCVHSSDFNDGRAVLDVFDGAFLPWFVVGIQRPIPLNTIEFSPVDSRV